MQPLSPSSPFLILEVFSLPKIIFPRAFSDEGEAEWSLMFWFDDIISSEDLFLISAINASAFTLVLLVELPGFKN